MTRLLDKQCDEEERTLREQLGTIEWGSRASNSKLHQLLQQEPQDRQDSTVAEEIPVPPGLLREEMKNE